MHELSVAQEIISITYKEMYSRQLSRIAEIGLKIGALSGIDPEALSFGFEASTSGTPLASVQLQIEFIPAKGKCNSCRKDFMVDEFIFICPDCGSSDVSVTEGEELDIAYFIGE